MCRFIKSYFLFFFLCACAANTKGQELTVGDTLPDYTFTSMFRYGKPAVKLSDFKGKILILDLWRTTCSHCMSSFTHFDSLTAAFPGQVAVLAITSENRNMIGHYLTDNGYVKATKVPVVTDDSVLAGHRFPFIYIPHVIVVNTRGIIVAITAPETITAGVIQDLLAGTTIKLPVKKEIVDFDYNVPVLTEGKGRNLPAMAYSSTLLHGLPGVLDLSETDTSGDCIFYKAYNMTIPDLYAQVYHFFLTPNRLVLQTKDSSRFFTNPANGAETQSKNLWVYNLILPKGTVHTEQYALQDLNRFFHTTARMETRRVACLELRRTGTGTRWRSKSNNGYYTDSAGIILIHNITLNNICTNWDMSFPHPVINETGLSNETADLTVPDTVADLRLFRKKLREYNLDLVPTMRDVKMLVITDHGE